MPLAVDDYRALLEGAALLDLESWCVLRLDGADTRDFLQGMATQDLASTGPSHAASTLFLTEKGRPVALAWVVIDPSGASARIVADEGARTTLRPHFERFRIMEDVEFQGPDRMPRVVGVAGPERERRLAALATTIPGAQPIHADPLSFLLVPAETPPDKLPQPADPDAAEAWRLRTGLPRTGVDFDLDRIATELSLPQAIADSKGCYVGQEVVARTSIRGQVRRRRIGFRFPWTGAPIPSRTELRTDQGSVTGFVTSTAPEPGSNKGIGMGYLATDIASSKPAVIVATGAQQTPITILDWPLQTEE